MPPQALGEIGLVALSGAAGVAPIVGSSAGHVVQGKKSARTVAVRRQTHVGSGTGHVALVVQPQAVAGNAGASGQLCLRVGDVDADGTHWRVDSGTGNRSAIALRDLNTPQRGEVIAETACVGPFGETEMGQTASGVAQRSRTRAEPGRTCAQRLWHGGKAHVEPLAAPVRLGNHHFQITPELVGYRSSMTNGPGATLTSWMTMPFWRMLTTALPSAMPRTAGA